MSENPTIRVAVMGGMRTPFVKAATVFKKYSALDLSVHAVNGLLESQKLDPQSIDEFVHGITVVDPRIPHLAREVVLQSHLPASVNALTATNNCITGTSAITAIYDSIVAGRAEIGIAGGVESMSHAAVLFNKRASSIFLDANSAKSLRRRLAELARLRPSDFKPTSPGIEEPSTGYCQVEPMGGRVGP